MITKPLDIDEYISSFPIETQIILEQVRATIKEVAPQAEEVISYGMPAFKLNGMLVWFAGYKHHIAFYPKASAIAAFKKELSVYKGAKGSVQFPLTKPMPLEIIKRMVEYRITENLKQERKK